ncbi:uncharacterized protein LOC126825406 [Patella vulgata]|uniref:uncharacterized protein LOC126825406 n=1 Tax=Patella vulgata TaxID=6465 RepID=UPI0024A88D26|nr:uncharacterized protein LOC126825406 [Patella vulgata]
MNLKRWEFVQPIVNVRRYRYQIGLPWKSDANLLPDNYKLAEKRLLSLESSLSKDPVKSELYCQVMKDYITNEWAVKLSLEEVSQPIKLVYYLPHFGVYRPDKASTPLGIVFDPACQFQGTSLNQFLLKGPCLIGNLFGVLIWFREEPVAIVGDISKMFLQVRLREEDSQVHWFLWRNMDTTRDPDIYRLLRVTFGDKSSPDMASYVMNKIAMVHQNEYPEAAAILQRDRYMDDLIHSCSSQDEAIKRMNDLDKLLIETGKFKIKEWYCSASSVKSSQSVNEVSLDGEDDLKTLGLGWNPVMDILKFAVKSVNVSVFTKRIVLSKMSSLFDPLGLASPITIKMRMAMQEIWRHTELQWDDHLSSDFNQLWSILFDEMFRLNNLSYPRCLKPVNAYGQPELHTFCDASLKAFGAVIYIVWTTSNGREVQLVTSKAKVSPLRQSTIPRLELMAVLVGSRLTKTVIDELRTKPVLVNIWSDSHIVLNWIQSESINMKPFVGVRVTEIQSLWELSQFKYLPTDLNPADDLSRGLTIDRMTERWMSGPESEWPVQSNMSITIEDDNELKRVKPLFPVVKSSSTQPIIDPVKYSSYFKLLRITSYVYRFINNLKALVNSRRSKSYCQEIITSLN